MKGPPAIFAPAVLLVLLSLSAAAVSASHCSGHTDCASCTADSTLGAACRWCGIDENCHDVDSPANHCTQDMEVTDASQCAALLVPQQIHLALASSAVGDGGALSDGMAASWATGARTNTSTLVYSTTKGFDPASAGAGGAVKSSAGAATHLLARFHHHAVATGLPPATRYYYRVGDAEAGYSDELSFVTAPADGTEGVSLSVFGDLGYGANGNAVATRARLEQLKDSEAFDAVWHLGDIGYADDALLHTPTEFEYEAVYDAFMANMQNVSATRPYMVLPGNHESECHSPRCLATSTFRDALSNFSAYNARWRMPWRESGGKGANMWSSFNYGLAHFVSWNSETDFPNAGEETHGDSGVLPAGGFAQEGELLRWLEADLKAADANRAVRPWVFVGSHRQLYRPPDGKTNGEVTAAVEALFLKYHVDAHFSGHAHTYGRTYPVAAGNRTGGEPSETSALYRNPTSPAYIVAGAAGCDESKLSPGASVEVAPTAAATAAATATAATASRPAGTSKHHGMPLPAALDSLGSARVREQWAAVHGSSGRAAGTAEGTAGTAAAWVAHVDTSNYGTGVLHVLNRTHVRWDYISSGTGKVLDSVTIVQDGRK